MTRVTVEHLWALYEAIEMAEEFFAGADPECPENEHGFKRLELAGQCRPWIKREIFRRQQRKQRK